jgi:hypothetical protein
MMYSKFLITSCFCLSLSLSLGCTQTNVEVYSRTYFDGIDSIDLQSIPLDLALKVDLFLESCDPNMANSRIPFPYEADERSCDLLDNDCDGKVDENLDEDITCGIGACENRGQKICINGQTVSQCFPKPIISQEDQTCNAMDEDCDGLNDNDFIPTPIDCGEGSCSASGFNNCINGELQSTCQPLETARSTSDVNCDSIDEDCDGFLDEDYQPKPIICNQGACQRMGSRTCRNGQLQDQCERVFPQPEEFDTSCNGIDDDCDGRVDESYSSTVITCGIGVCQATGTQTCSNGEEIVQCEPLRAFASDIICNGLDDDCDSIIDENCTHR